MLRRLKSHYQRWRIERHPITDRAWSAAIRAVPYADALPPAQRTRLRELATLFQLDKNFTSAHGLVITDTMRAIIALKACLPILELGLHYYSTFKGIVVYPGDFQVQEHHTDEAGVVHEEIRELCGQSLAQGPMVLSWDTITKERADDGQDLVIHECAHKLDTLNGEADGFPPLHADMSLYTWTRTLRTAYDRLYDQVNAGQATRIDPYACEDAAEFFAVATETFFTRPDIMAEDFPEVYRELSVFYRQDPHALLRRTSRQ